MHFSAQHISEGCIVLCMIARTPGIQLTQKKRGMVEHVHTDLPFTQTEYNTEHSQIDAEE